MANIPVPAQAAVSFAKAHVGDGYLYGAIGPDKWDCSGLTMVAWQHGGVSLPHNSLLQCESTVRVYYQNLTLTPGDLIFYYLPISHVAMYIGKDALGRKFVVQATAPGIAVEIVRIDKYAEPVHTGRVKYEGWQNY